MIRRIFEVYPRETRLQKQRKLLKKMEKTKDPKELRYLELKHMRPDRLEPVSFEEPVNMLSKRLVTLVFSNDKDYSLFCKFARISGLDRFVVVDDNKWLIKAAMKQIKRSQKGEV